MKTIHNRTPRPLKISLRRGKFLHLGPGKSGQIADPDLERPAVQRLLKAEEIEVVGGEPHLGATGGGGKGTPGSTHGHPPEVARRGKGDR